jgi:DNA-binding response OmpR family regulator
MGGPSLAAANILIVDDYPANLRVLEDMLRLQGYEVRSFPRGRMALTAAARNPPDLVLLDINMPEMDGYEVCGHLKSSPETAGIPVIFLSALDETGDKVKAFRSGGVDFISKPFQYEEVQARVETHLKLHALQLELKRHNERLEETVAARTRELAVANERLTVLDRSKSDFLNLISHEFRTPLFGILGVSELMLEDLPVDEESNRLRDLFDRSRRRILAIIDDALLLAQIDLSAEHPGTSRVPLSKALAIAIGKAGEFAKSRRVTLGPPLAGLALIEAEEELLVRAFQALLETAVKFSSEGETVRLASEPGAITIEGHGLSIPEAALGKFFDIFSIGQAITPGGDLGLGPPVAQRIFALFGAQVLVANLETVAGIRLTVEVPAGA